MIDFWDDCWIVATDDGNFKRGILVLLFLLSLVQTFFFQQATHKYQFSFEWFQHF